MDGNRGSSTPRRERRPPPPLDAAGLERLALRYVERFATTRGRLAEYLARKLRERGWGGQGDPDPRALAERFAELGYVNDRLFAEARASSMARRGLGTRRVRDALRRDGVEADDAEPLLERADEGAGTAALAYARRKRLGPYAAAPADREAMARQLAAMARAGHPYALARAVLELEPGAEPDPTELIRR